MQWSNHTKTIVRGERGGATLLFGCGGWDSWTVRRHLVDEEADGAQRIAGLHHGRCASGKAQFRAGSASD